MRERRERRPLELAPAGAAVPQDLRRRYDGA
jgi:hypothetical protein